MTIAIQVILLLIIVIGFLGMIGEGDRNLRTNIAAVTTAAIISEVLIIYIQG